MGLHKPVKMSLLGLLLCLSAPLVAADASPSLLVATRNNITKISLGDMKVFPLVGGTKGSVGVDYDMARDVLYWSETEEPRIMAMPLPGSNSPSQVIIETGGLSTPDGIALDWVHRNLYWTDATLNTIEVINLETRLRKVLINENLAEARAIVVDPRDEHGPYMYWTDWGTEAMIERAGLDGSNRKRIVAENIRWPNGLAIDFTQNRIYWIDSKLHYVGSADLLGQSQLVIFRTDSQHQIFAMDLFQDYLYYSEWNTKAIYRVNKQSRNETVLVMRDTKAPNGIRVIHDLRQPSATNRCDGVVCPASSLCLPSPSLSWHLNHTCVCADHPSTSIDTCTPGPGVQITTRATTPVDQGSSTAVTPSSGASGGGLDWNVIGLPLFIMVANMEGFILMKQLYE